MKAGVAGFFAWQIRKIQLKFVDKNNNLFKDILQHNTSILNQLDVSDDENFLRFFETDLPTIRENLTSIITTCENALNPDLSIRYRDEKKWPKVKPVIEKLKIQAELNLVSFDSLFKFNAQNQDAPFTIPPELTKLTRYLWATEKITSYSEDKAMKIGLRHWLNALLLAGGLGVAATVGETLVFPALDKALDEHI